ncbi:hypothetical protein AB7C87_23295 [Natrarchaeobius sp. A-rgal3]|uniref:hypothetical protein n=1 Tax=Natrarchaeobius versutus TaxID=1679078 RepID=UPI00350FEA30
MMTGAAEPSQDDYYDNIDSEVLEAFSENGSDGVHEVLESHELNYRLNSSTVVGREASSREDPSDEEELTPQRWFDEDESEINAVAFETSGSNNEARVQVMMSLDGWTGSFRDTTYVEDVIGISWAGDWTPTDESIRTPDDNHDISFWSESLEGGVAALVDLSEDSVLPWIDSDDDFLLAATLSAGSDPGSVHGYYQHNIATSPTANINSIEGSLSTNPLDIVMDPSATTDWDVADPTEAVDVVS